MATVRFEVQTPLGFIVRTTNEYWERIVNEKHRNMRDREDEVKSTLADPDVVIGKVLLTPMSSSFTDPAKMGGRSRSSAVKMEKGF